MSGMGGKEMMWMRMPGQTWPGVAASFVGMWILMMVPMMLPSIGPMLWRYRQAIAGSGHTSAVRVCYLTSIVSLSYLLVWTAVGVAVFPIGVALSTVVQREPALAHPVSFAKAAVVIIAGVLQLERWKMRRLAPASGATLGNTPTPPDTSTAWRCGLRLGVQCVQSCVNLMVISMVMGIMDLRVMTAIGAVIAAERLTQNAHGRREPGPCRSMAQSPITTPAARA
jgi:predicted metal-binding membrane protein